MKIDIRDWLDTEEQEKCELAYRYAGVTKADELLINFDRVFVYDGYTKEEFGKDVAWSYGMDSNDGCKKYFNYEAFADDLLNEGRYYELEEDEKYMYLDEICTTDDDSIVLGKLTDAKEFANNQYVKLQKHSWACGWYWSYGHISNNSLSCGIEEYLPLELNEAFKKTWLDVETWDRFRLVMLNAIAMRKGLEKLSDEDNMKLKTKLDSAWNILKEKYKDVKFVFEMENEDDN